MKTTLLLLITASMLFFGSFFLAGCDDDPASPNGGNGNNVILVANQNAGTISLINVDTDEVYRDRVGVGNTPNDMIYDDDKLYIINSMSADMNVFTISTENTFSTYHVPINLSGNIGNSPQFGAITENGLLCISNFVTNRVTTLNLSNFTLGIDIVLDYPGASDILAIGNMIYVCCTGYIDSTHTVGEGAVTVINTETYSKENIVFEAGKSPQFIAVDPAGNLHVVCSGVFGNDNGEIRVIDPTTNDVIRYYYISAYLKDIAITPAGIAYIASYSATGVSGSVFRYNTTTGQIMNGTDAPIVVGSGPMRLMVGPENEVYVSCWNDDRVDKIIEGLMVKSYIIGDGPAPMVFIAR